MIRNFVWGEKKNPVKEETLFAPKSEGGRELLDIKARNEAIRIMLLKTYLQLDDDRPLWAKYADKILALNIPKAMEKVPLECRTNIFTQTWDSHMGYKNNKNPKSITAMIRTAKKYNLRIEAVKVTKDAAGEMPPFYHLEAPALAMQMRRRTMKCLKTEHACGTVKELLELADRARDPAHELRPDCNCQQCTEVRANTACENPDLCYNRARDITNSIPDKWDPARIPEIEEPEPPAPGDEWIPFPSNSNLTTKIKNCFRIFTRGEKSTHQNIVKRQEPPAAPVTTVEIATDGSCIHANTTKARAGAGIFIAEGDERNAAIRVPANLPQTNQVAEMFAVYKTAEMFPGNELIKILSDSRYVINTLTNRLPEAEDRGFIEIANGSLIRATIAMLRKRRGRTMFKWVKGHQGNMMNEGADQMAGEGAALENPNDMTLDEYPEQLESGAKLSMLTQALAYRGIRQMKNETRKHRRERTNIMINVIQTHLEDSMESSPNEAQIWAGTKHKDFSKQTRFFLWMAVHDAYKIGDYWVNIVGGEYTERGLCRHCNNRTEDMAHILTTCDSPGQKEIWNLAKKAWERTGHAWRQPWLGDILGCGTISLKNENNKILVGETRLWRVLIAESAYLIWKLRCERVIQRNNTPLTREEVLKRWHLAINERLFIDIRMTHKRYKTKAVKKSLVAKTCGKILEQELELPEDWIDSGGVLVGRRLKIQIHAFDNG